MTPGRHRADAVDRRAPRRRRAARSWPPASTPRSRREGGLPARLGMELGWIVTGLAHHVAAGGSATGERLLRAVARPAAGAQPRPRAASSATSARAAGAGASRTSPPRSTPCSRSPSSAATGSTTARCAPPAPPPTGCWSMQLPDGGWPWLFDAERGTVVERYEVYSVHQDAMAPMGLFELSEATGDPRYRDAAVRGLAWIHGDNELGPTWSTARTSSCCARSAAAAARPRSGSPARPPRRSPACRRPARPRG